MIPLAFVLLLAALFAGVLFAGLRLRWPGFVLLLLGISPVVFVYLWSEDLRNISTHGMLHGSIVYRLMDVGVVPDCPLLAGQPLLYPWGHHWVVAWLSTLFACPPGTSFAILNVLALAGTLFFAYRLGHLLTQDRVGAVLAASLAVFGVTFFNYHRAFNPIYGLTGLELFHLRNPVVLKKFSNLNSNGIGYFFYSIFLYSAVQIFSKPQERPSRLPYLGLATAVAGAEFFYPISWLVMGVCLGGMSIVALARHRAAALPTIVRAGLTALLASLVVAPYMWVIDEGKAQQMFLFAPDLGFLATKLVGYALTMTPALLLLVWQRDAVRRVIAERGDAFYTAAAAAGSMFVLYVLIGTDWMTNEYKFLGAGCFAMGIVTSVALAALYRSRPAVWFGVTVLLMVSAGGDIYGKIAARHFHLAEPYVARGGSTLHHADPEEDRLYRWILANTTPDAVLVDDRLTIPVFARRALYIGLDERGVTTAQGLEDGWGFSPDVILRLYYAYPPKIIDHRTAVAEAIYDHDGSALPAGVLDELRADTADAPVFIVARDAGTRARLEQTHRVEPVFATSAASLYRLEGAS